MSNNYLKIRNVEVEEGRTTIKLEPAFWDMLLEICALERTNLNLLIQQIDRMRGNDYPRASAIRVFVLKYFAPPVTKRSPRCLAKQAMTVEANS